MPMTLTLYRKIAFFLVALVLIVAAPLSYVAVADTEKLGHRLDVVYSDAIMPLATTAELDAALQMVQIAALTSIYGAAPQAQHYTGQVAVEADRFRSMLDRYNRENTALTQSGMKDILERHGVLNDHVSREQTALRVINEDFPRLQRTINGAIELSNAGRKDQAAAEFARDAQPLFDRIEAQVRGLQTAQLEEARYVSQDAGVIRTSTLRQLTILVVLTIAIGLATAFALARLVIRPVHTLTAAADVMRTGDFSGRLPVDRSDEFGVLARGFNRMAEELTGLVRQVQDSGLQVDSSVVAIAASAKEHQATANEIAATTTEIGATSREISATSKELVKTMSDVSHLAEQSASLASAGQIGLSHMEDTMRHVMEAAGSVNAKLVTLNEKAADISQVVTTITKVADQTNLLSLNAAIEAEKAGEYGRGFAVVATEIRRLADQTAVATYDIDQTVKAIQSAVSAGVMSMDRFSEEVRRGVQAIQEVGGQLSQVIQHVLALPPRFEAVTGGMQAQATGAEQITEALTQLSEAARHTVESLRQSNTAIDNLNQVASALRSGVSRFTLQSA
jgi:methyl-accepting chemotaxis protein WspA